MNFNSEQKKACSVCHAYLFDEDDVVYCPECGAPHHRDCYNTVGHCALEEFHGTENQYDIVREREKANQESQKDEKSAGDNIFKDERQSAQFDTNMPPIMFPNFDVLGGIPKDMDLGEGVTADEAKHFVLVNTHRYIPKFAAMSAGSKASWNWLAFLFPSAWYMSRKMYLKGVLSCILLVAFSLLTLPVLNEIAVLDTSAATSYFEYSKILSQNISTIGALPILLSFLGSALNIISRIIIGIFADYHYRNHVINTITQIKSSDTDDIKTAFMKKGGTSFFGMMLGFFALQYLPSVIAMFI